MRITPLALAALLSLPACQDQPPPAAATGGPPTAQSAAGTTPTQAPAQADGLKVGDAAPDLTLKLHDGKDVKLADKRDTLVLVYFYPKDDTPGCTVEAQGIRDAWTKFQEAGIEVYGVSTQDAASHQSFIDKHSLPFPLVVDEGGAVAAAFKVPVNKGFAARQSFLIGKDGKIKAVWPKVDPSEHAQAVLDAAKT